MTRSLSTLRRKKFHDEVPLIDRDELWKMMGEYFERGDDPNRDPVIRRQVVMQDEIGRWGAGWTFEDEPYLIPYIVEGSKDAVLIVPGGAYVMKSMEHEGTEVAELLNKEGISCFVLWYRTWPYKFPAAYLDTQRAVRYIKAHADEYGYSPDRVSIMGFSAGGNAAAASWHLLKKEEKPLWGDEYMPDNIDQIDPRPAAIALIYSALEVSRDPQALHMLAGKEEFDDPAFDPSIRVHGIACKAIFDCTVPYNLKDQFERCKFLEVDPAKWLPDWR